MINLLDGINYYGFSHVVRFRSTTTRSFGGAVAVLDLFVNWVSPGGTPPGGWRPCTWRLAMDGPGAVAAWLKEQPATDEAAPWG